MMFRAMNISKFMIKLMVSNLIILVYRLVVETHFRDLELLKMLLTHLLDRLDSKVKMSTNMLQQFNYRFLNYFMPKTC